MKNKLLLVDDDAVVQMLHQMTFANLGVQNELMTFENGKTVLEYLKNVSSNNTDQFIILLDINMPVMGGWEFLDALEKEFKIKDYCKIYIVTSSINLQDKNKAKTYKNVIDYLEKPLDIKKCEYILSYLNIRSN